MAALTVGFVSALVFTGFPPSWPDTSICRGSEKHSARSLDSLCVDPAVVGRKQRRDDAADVIGLAHATQRGLRGEEPVELRIVAHHAVAEIGFDRAGTDHIHGDAAR